MASTTPRSESPAGRSLHSSGLLSESTYEFVDTDTESRGDADENAATESIASTDYGRPDDIASIADTDNSDDVQSEAEAVPSFHGLDGPIATPTIGQSISMSMDEKRLSTDSIEFEEPIEDDTTDAIAVRHTFADFNEEQTVAIVQNMKLRDNPERLVATVRQTMGKRGLPTREPLRLLYVGSHAAKKDIIHKIASAVSVSVTDPQAQSRSTSSQMYNVVPVSAFGSESIPEIELMHSSGIQISVEDCVTATSLKFEDEPNKPDVIKLTVEDTFSYHSVPDAQGFIIEPEWEHPHLAIIYCAENDSAETKCTRMLVSNFMFRHGIPSIVISHKLCLDKPHPSMLLDRHAPHICLESRDVSGSGTIVEQRLPIDLTSFLNIDARQMNRNLAYLTRSSFIKQEISLKENTLTKFRQWNKDAAWLTSGWKTLVPFLLMLTSILFALATGLNIFPHVAPAVSINGNPSTSVVQVTDSTELPSMLANVLSTLTSTHTSTRTVTVAQASSSVTNSISVLPSMELSKVIPEAQSNSQLQQPQQSGCSAEIIGDREVLVRIPYSTKSSWLSKEAVSLKITRNNQTVETERIYSSDEGMLLQFARKDAVGHLEINIVTSRKPKINETVSVQFETTWAYSFQDAFSWVSNQVHEQVDILTVNMEELAASISSSYQDLRKKAQKLELEIDDYTADIANQAYSSAKEALAVRFDLLEAAKSTTFNAAQHAAELPHTIGSSLSKARETIAKPLRSLDRQTLTQAQVQAKLYWLKLQGKTDEYHEYLTRASNAMKAQREQKEADTALPETVRTEESELDSHIDRIRKQAAKIRAQAESEAAKARKQAADIKAQVQRDAARAEKQALKQAAKAEKQAAKAKKKVKKQGRK